MKVRVLYGRLNTEQLKRASCLRCHGEGQSHAGWSFGLPVDDPGPLEPCPRCDGTGAAADVGYTYSAAFPVARGDIVLVGTRGWGERYREQEATVIGVGSTFDGETRQIIQVVEHAGQAS